MVGFARKLPGIRKYMNGVSQLSRPILGDLSREGVLLRADEALRKLNLRAGGIEGGTIAIPALYNLGTLSARLSMRLSRAVRVLDDPDNLELWVEVEPVGEIIRIAILSWRSLGQHLNAGDFDNGRDKEFSGYHSRLIFDRSQRLIQSRGVRIEGLVASDFGKSAQELFEKLFSNIDVSHNLLKNLTSMDPVPPFEVALIRGDNVLLSGHPWYDENDTPIGYQCRLERILPSEPMAIAEQEASTPGALFGKHLAPVLRQPLGRIIANAETIGSELQGPIRENYAAYARDIANAARHLSALVDDLGDLEAIERADFSTAPDKIELGDVARRVAGLLALKAADHSIRLITPDADIKVGATAEFRRTLQIMLNLVTNAIRYSPDGTEVTIEIGQTGQSSFISVADQGRGIKADDRGKVFEKFERLGRSGDGGSGLGLYISRRLALAMGGDLTVEEAKGGGAIFTLRLPSI
jgi:two-component sensor histidine kinase